MEEDPDRYDCGGCERKARVEALWPENREAWDLHLTLCGRTVTTRDLSAWVLSVWFGTTPDLETVTDMLDRLDLIANEIAAARDGRESTADGPRRPDA